MKAYRKVVVASDFSAGSRGTIGAVEAIAGKQPLVVDLVHVLEPVAALVPTAPIWLEHEQARRSAALAELERFGAALAKRLGTGARIRTHLLGGSPAHEICRFADAKRADLIVVGSHGRTGFRRAMIGSVAERVARHAGRPVLIVPGAGSHPRRR